MNEKINPVFIAGPCVIESQELLDEVASELVTIRKHTGIEVIFKASFDKANRTSLSSFRGPGMERGLRMLADIKSRYGLRITTDIHESCQAEPVGQVVDIIQIPAPPSNPCIRASSRPKGSKNTGLPRFCRQCPVPCRGWLRIRHALWCS